MLRLYFENNKPSSDLNSNNIFEADSLPIPGRKEYSCLGEVVEEFVSNWDHIMYTIDRIIKKILFSTKSILILTIQIWIHIVTISMLSTGETAIQSISISIGWK